MSGKPPIIFLSNAYFESISTSSPDGRGVFVTLSDWISLCDKGAQMVDLMRIMHGVRNENMVAKATIARQAEEIAHLTALAARQAELLAERDAYTEKTTRFILRLMHEIPDAMARLEKEAAGS